MSSPFRLYTRLCFPSLPGVVSTTRGLSPLRSCLLFVLALSITWPSHSRQSFRSFRLYCSVFLRLAVLTLVVFTLVALVVSLDLASRVFHVAHLSHPSASFHVAIHGSSVSLPSVFVQPSPSSTPRGLHSSLVLFFSVFILFHCLHTSMSLPLVVVSTATSGTLSFPSLPVFHFVGSSPLGVFCTS